MNPKQAAPLLVMLPALAAAAPPLIIGEGICVVGFLLLKRLFSADEEKQPEAVPATAAPERPALVVPSFSGGNSVQNRSIPPTSGGKPNMTPAPAIVPASSAPAVLIIPVPQPSAIPAMNIAPQVPLPPPIKKKFITREDVANVFQRGARALTRTAAVAKLKQLGSGKTAAYAALTPDGRFSAWLQFAPDGIITWTE
jgi:hypothetical protein